MKALPSNPGGPDASGVVVYRQGDSCPVCGAAVEYADVDVSPHPVPGYRARARIGGPGAGATLMPCGHYCHRVLPPGNGGGGLGRRLAGPPGGV